MENLLLYCISRSITDVVISIDPQDKTQCTMLTTWLVELYLNELGVLQDQGRIQEKQRVQRDFHDMLRKDMLKVCIVCANHLNSINIQLSYGHYFRVFSLLRILTNYSSEFSFESKENTK